MYIVLMVVLKRIVPIKRSITCHAFYTIVDPSLTYHFVTFCGLPPNKVCHIVCLQPISPLAHHFKGFLVKISLRAQEKSISNLHFAHLVLKQNLRHITDNLSRIIWYYIIPNFKLTCYICRT